MIKQHKDESRAAYVMRVAAAYINKYPDFEIEYDGTTCDGYCLAEELEVLSECMPDAD